MSEKSICLSLTYCNNKDIRAASSYILYSVFTHSIAAARLYLFINSLKFYYYGKFNKQASEC